ncbi:hypothetical protein CLOSTMETH_00121 [[Clostridium] methylpentosum DSM 5476]|uniref:Uncharacterized protein n=1 Tax=[Clostridium] methylpentosum DSM 5476 TaxID=537013 RepID=C0E8H6_9FIRM|nr:hypothetical protein CLOSTMETH_00121 [[Clostridium] methylpentosum DSM 5476]
MIYYENNREIKTVLCIFIVSRSHLANNGVLAPVYGTLLTFPFLPENEGGGTAWKFSAKEVIKTLCYVI